MGVGSAVVARTGQGRVDGPVLGRPAGDPGHADDVRAGTAVFADAVEVLGQLLGVEFDELRCDVEFAHATEAVELTDLVIADGHVAAMDVNWNGVIDGREQSGPQLASLLIERVAATELVSRREAAIAGPAAAKSVG